MWVANEEFFVHNERAKAKCSHKLMQIYSKPYIILTLFVSMEIIISHGVQVFVSQSLIRCVLEICILKFLIHSIISGVVLDSYYLLRFRAWKWMLIWALILIVVQTLLKWTEFLGWENFLSIWYKFQFSACGICVCMHACMVIGMNMHGRVDTCMHRREWRWQVDGQGTSLWPYPTPWLHPPWTIMMDDQLS